MTESSEPLSLNERNARLLTDLSANRLLDSTPHRPKEIRVRKVKIEGRRRLCKVSSPSDATPVVDASLLDSPPDAAGGAGEESIQDILDSLTERMESLSVRKPAPRPRTELETPASLFPSLDKEVGPKDRVELSSGDEGSSVVLVRKQQPRRTVTDDGSRLIDVNSGDESVGVVCADEDEAEDGKEEEDCSIRMPGTGASSSRTYELSGKIAKMLYAHQREGLTWLWSLHCMGTGGILGDDMGLGKTMQISAFLAGLFRSRLIKRALIVAPKTLLSHWMKELSVVGLAEKTRDYSGTSLKAREYELRSTLKEGGVLLTTYDIVRNNTKSIRGDWYAHVDQDDEEFIWDYVILDEGHIVKNPSTQRSKSLHEIPCAHRIIISGTPIQNNLKELWALFYFCCPEILGDKDMFKIKYENPIIRGNDKNASDRDKYRGSAVAKELRERIKPYFLRRLKSDVFLETDETKGDKLSNKNEMIVWLKLTPCQRQLYEAFLNSDMVHSSFNGSPLAALTILKKICDHPFLLTKKAAEEVLEGMDTMLNNEERNMVEDMAMNLANMAVKDEFEQVDQTVSCKISFVMTLLENLLGEGHTVLIFSQTRKMLNLIQEAIVLARYKFLRIDGTTKISDREKIVKEFQGDFGAPIFLLTSQVGGLGLTLTKADRVIVVDPAWNPSTDNQSVDRAYRIGQTKDVLVYRLMTCGTIEEKIYKMQVFKGGLFRTATEHKEQTRYFSQKDIRELFTLPEQGFDVSVTQQQLHEEHDQHHSMEVSLVNHIKFLQKQGIAGISHHSLLYSKTATTPFVAVDDTTDRKMGNKIVRSSPSHSSVELVTNGAQFAFKPKELPRSSGSQSSERRDSPEPIEERIKRLTQTLSNKELVSRLPDKGAKIQMQLAELRTQLEEIREANRTPPLEKKDPGIIDLDCLTDDLQKTKICTSASSAPSVIFL